MVNSDLAQGIAEALRRELSNKPILVLQEHYIDRKDAIDVFFDWLDQVLEGKGQELEDFFHHVKVVSVKHLDGLGQNLMQKLLVNLVSQVFDQSDAEVENDGLG